ncbi:recombination regulator RecX [Actinomadura rubrisoli]|uniref:Regulatory protein RecX n=1 Tax=Actinomadura rubrisoli TaxID=2530368 RepID=A0A4R5BC11_9ACTN|nr:recombination regulator RecX [Actinomadura rubrisoli]TDD83641.1 recombination regulator RecX [Actinomadura rubrisoli]
MTRPSRDRPNDPWAFDTGQGGGSSPNRSPTREQPASKDPGTREPAATGSSTGQPSTGQPSTGQPTTGQPTTGQPTTGQPAAGQPTTEGRAGGRSASAGKRSMDPEAMAREICLRLLASSPRTRSQLADALRRKDVPDDVAERVLSRFTDVGLIDDEAFAQAWVQTRHNGRGLAKRALAAELRRRGVDNETVNDAVESLAPDQEEQTARTLIARKLRATQGLDPAKRTRRLVGMLARKGYSPGLSYRVVKEALAEEGTDLGDLSEPPSFD